MSQATGSGAHRGALGLTRRTLARVLIRAGLSRLSDPLPAEPVVRNTHEATGDMLHIDAKKLGRIKRSRHRVARNRQHSAIYAGWETLVVASNDHACLAFADANMKRTPPTRCSFCTAHTPTAPAWARAPSACCPTTQRPCAHEPLRWAGGRRASVTASRESTGHRRTARPSDASSRLCESGFVATHNKTPARERQR